MPIIHLLLFGMSFAFERRPQNTVVKIGESFDLTCQHTSPDIDWYHNKILSIDDKKSERKLTKGYNINITGQGLSIASANIEHAGIYSCIVITEQKTTETASAVIVVLGNDPCCVMNTKETLLENDQIEMRCLLSHFGPATPVMRWKQVKDSAWKELNSTQTLIIQHQTTSQLRGIADLTMHQSQFKLETSFNFSHFESIPEISNNTPNPRFWTSPTIHILYGPQNLTVSPSDGVLDSNEQANCSADGYPSPYIEWINPRSNKTTLGPSLEVGENLPGDGPRVFTCRAVNLATNRTANITIEFRIKELPTTTIDQTGQTNYLLVRLLLPAFAVSVVIICGLIVFIISRRRKERRMVTATVKTELENTRGIHRSPVRRISRHTFPPPTTNVQHLGSIDNQSPPSDITAASSPSSDYDEIPARQSLSVQNFEYFDQPPTKSLPLQSSSSSSSSQFRHYELADGEGGYESLLEK